MASWEQEWLDQGYFLSTDVRVGSRRVAVRFIDAHCIEQHFATAPENNLSHIIAPTDTSGLFTRVLRDRQYHIVPLLPGFAAVAPFAHGERLLHMRIVEHTNAHPLAWIIEFREQGNPEPCSVVQAVLPEHLGKVLHEKLRELSWITDQARLNSNDLTGFSSANVRQAAAAVYERDMAARRALIAPEYATQAPFSSPSPARTAPFAPLAFSPASNYPADEFFDASFSSLDGSFCHTPYANLTPTPSFSLTSSHRSTPSSSAATPSSSSLLSQLNATSSTPGSTSGDSSFDSLNRTVMVLEQVVTNLREDNERALVSDPFTAGSTHSRRSFSFAGGAAPRAPQRRPPQALQKGEQKGEQKGAIHAAFARSRWRQFRVGYGNRP